MQEVERGYFPSPAPAFERGGVVWPASRLRWSAVLGGAVVLLAVSLLLWGLAFAITALATPPLATSSAVSGMALWICAMVSTVIGAVVGGWFAGRAIAEAPRALGAAHGFAAWAVALLLSFGVQFFMFRDVVTAAVFQSIGGEGNAGAGADAEHAARLAHAYFTAASWSWVATWLVAAIGAVAAGAAASAWLRRSAAPRVPRIEERRFEPVEPVEPTSVRPPFTRSPAE
jgi:hypothetical protein